MKPALRALSCFILILSAAGSVQAQAEDQATARALFDEGRKFMKAGQYTAACPKFEAALTLYSSAGILLNLADCYEKSGRTASAWSKFGEAASVASRSNRTDDADEAKRRQSVIEPSLTRLSIRVGHPAAGLVVKRDGAVLASAAWGTMLPVDPGAHEVRAEAPGFEPWTFSVTLSKPGQTATVEVPELHASGTAPPGEPAAVSAVSSAAPSSSSRTEPLTESASTAPSRGGSSRVLPWALVGGGAAVGAAGVVLMLIESGKASSARDNHDPAAYDAAQTPWTIGLVGAIAGGVAAGAGAVLLTTSHGNSSTGTSVTPWVGVRGGGVRVGGSW